MSLHSLKVIHQISKETSHLSNEDEIRLTRKQEAIPFGENDCQPIFDSSPLGMAILDRDLTYVRVNESLCHLLQFKTVYFENKSFKSSLYGDSFKEFRELSKLVFNAEFPSFGTESRFVYKNNQSFIAQLTVNGLKNKEGIYTHLVVIVQNMTLQQIVEKAKASAATKQLEIEYLTKKNELQAKLIQQAEQIQLQNLELQAALQKIKESQAELELKQSMLSKAEEVAHLGSWHYDKATKELILSEECLRVHGLKAQPKKWMYKDFLKLVHEEDRAMVKAALTAMVKDNMNFDLTYRIVLPNGQTKWLRGNIVITEYENGEVLKAVGSVLDVDQTKRIEAALMRSNQELEQFAYTASHDLKQPLRTISGFAQLLKEQFADVLDEEGQEYIGYIISGTTNMNGLIQGLLEYAKLSSTKEDALLNMNVNQVIGLVSQNLRGEIRESNTQIYVDNLPTQVRGVRIKLIQLFQNLIANAIKFRKQNEACVIQIWAEEQPLHWQFGIKDNGIGIPAGFEESIFQLFRKLHGPSEYTGSGIGLATCRKIVTQHGGDLWVESKEGQGATFFFTIPK
ncbi:MAG: ATP-binding protein [Chitinophagales bacterium]